ncbi:hypothetical protein [Desulfovibrio sp. X2]|uniref:hypothetical protein n=1 Tax=Desulfovibrio sp. X2 TaxID=941449 RepID=UPI001268433D|nr:hypothetical protein [Desulfovibrio sp. X2]
MGVRASFVEEADRLVADGVFDNVGRKHFYNVCREHPERCLKSRVRMTLKRREHFRRYMGF